MYRQRRRRRLPLLRCVHSFFSHFSFGVSMYLCKRSLLALSVSLFRSRTTFINGILFHWELTSADIDLNEFVIAHRARTQFFTLFVIVAICLFVCRSVIVYAFFGLCVRAFGAWILSLSHWGTQDSVVRCLQSSNIDLFTFFALSVKRINLL